MAMSDEDAKPYILQLEKMREDATYSAQAYYEASKSAEFWGRSIVLIPALLAGLAGLIIAFGGPRELGAVSAVSAVVAATAAFLGSEKRASSFKESARRFTSLRHRAAMEIDLAS